MSKVVLDTNVVIAAFASRGLCESVFELCLERHEIIISEFLLNELEEKLKKKIKLPSSAVEEILQLYSRNSRKVSPFPVGMEACRDSEDIPVIGTCISGEASYLITGDKDLLILGNFMDTKILTPREFYDSQSKG